MLRKFEKFGYLPKSLNTHRDTRGIRETWGCVTSLRHL